MAVTIQSQPTYPNAAYTHLLYSLSSTETDNPQFQYVMDITQNGQILTRIKQYPNPQAAAIFDPARILNDYIEYDQVWRTANVAPAVTSVQNFNIYFGEEYGTSPSSSVTLYNGSGQVGPPAVTGTTSVVFGGTIDPNNGSSFNWDAQSQALTNMPSTENYLAYDDYHTMSFYNDGSLGTVTVQYSPGQTLNYTLPTGFSTVPISSLNIGAPANWSTVLVTAGSQTWQFRLADDCNYERVRFAFINKDGFWDYYGVNLPYRRVTSIERQSLKKPFVNYSEAISSYNMQRRGTDYYNIQYNDDYTLSTDWLDQSQAEWLSEMLESPSVFVQQGSDFVPIIITNGTYTHNTNRRSQKTFQFDISYQYSNQRLGR